MRFQIEIGATTAAATTATTRTLAQVDGSHVCDLTFDNIWMVSKWQAGRRRGREEESRVAKPLNIWHTICIFLIFFRGYYWKLSRSGVYRDLMYICQSYVRVKILSNLISINPFPPSDPDRGHPGQPKGLLPNLINVANWFRLVMRSLGYIFFGFSMAREKRANCKAGIGQTCVTN